MAIDKVNTKRYAEEGLKTLHSKGESYLNGGDTTAFSTLGTNAVNIGTNVVGAGVLTYDVVKDFKNGDALAFAESLAGQAIGDISGECGALIGEYTGKAASLVASIPGKIAEETARRVGDPRVELGEEPIYPMSHWMDEVFNGEENNRKIQHEENNDKRKEEKIKKAKEIISDAVKRANKFMDIANEKIDYVKKYALEGPEWVADQMSNTVDAVVYEVRKELDGDYKYLEDQINKWCENEGIAIGDKIVKKANNELHKLAEETKNNSEETVTKGKIKAKSVLQKAKLTIMGRLGINIHIPISTD